MIPTLVNQHLPPARERNRRRNSHHVRLRPTVHEPDLLDRREPLADKAREVLLHDIMPAKVPAIVQGALDGAADGRVVVSVDAGCIFAEEVNVRVAVEVGEVGAMA